MVYPNGRTIDYNYSGANLNGTLDNAIGRLDSISDGANSGEAGQVLEQYSYLGLSTVIARNHPQTNINLTYLGSSGSIGSGGDQYVGLDQFGRIADQNWVNTSAGQSVDNFTYTYDNNSNVSAENDLLDAAYSQTFTYDLLNRLNASTLGGVANQSWTLDSQGNWSSYTSNGTTQTQTANAQNQITSISGTSATPTYDASGNTVSMGLTTQPAGSVSTLVYDAWNRLVAVKNSSGQVIAQYTYNAMGYRITETYPQGGTGIPAGEINYIYYDSQWQAIETRTNGTASSNVTSQTVWSAAYINAAILQDTYSGGAIQPNSRIYFLQDANWDTTAIVGYNSTTGTWGVTQRYVYSPYGTITVLNADWSTPPAGTNPAVNNLYQGMTIDPVTGLYYARNRNYSPSLGRWINQDPAGYINGANSYQFVESNPVGNVDPWGLSAIYDETIANASLPSPAGGAATMSIYVVDRSGGENTGFAGGHIDMVIPGVGVVGYYGTIPPGAGWAQAHGLGVPGFWNDSYKDFQGSRPTYVDAPGAGGYLGTVVKVPVTPEQLKRMRGELKNLEAHPGAFNITTNNCAENALKVLGAGGIDPNPWYHSGFENPQDLVDQLKQEGDKEFNGYTVENPSGSVTIVPVLPAPAPAKAPGSSGG